MLSFLNGIPLTFNLPPPLLNGTAIKKKKTFCGFLKKLENYH